jgi:hypothetical protein
VIGEIPLELVVSGKYQTVYPGDFFSDSGGEEIAVTVASTEGEETFPPFSGSLTAPAALVNAAAAVTPDGALEMEWSESDATYIEIVLRTGGETTATQPEGLTGNEIENRVRCFYLKDDGCFHVPHTAMAWLTSNGVELIKVRMERHVLQITKPAPDAITEVDAMRSIEFNINI